MAPERVVGPHARWWTALGERTRAHLLDARPDAELPSDIWRECLDNATAERLVELDGWFDDVTARKLPFPVACFVDIMRLDVDGFARAWISERTPDGSVPPLHRDDRDVPAAARRRA